VNSKTKQIFPKRLRLFRSVKTARLMTKTFLLRHHPIRDRGRKVRIVHPTAPSIALRSKKSLTNRTSPAADLLALK